jgi:hypothetical protein
MSVQRKITHNEQLMLGGNLTDGMELHGDIVL